MKRSSAAASLGKGGRPGGQPEAAFSVLFQTLPLGQLTGVILDLPLHLFQLRQVPGFGELGEGLHIDQRQLGRLGGFFELFEQFIDLFELFLDLDRLRDVHRLAAGEGVFGGQLVDLIFFAQAFEEMDHLAGEGVLVVADAVPEPFH